MSTCNFMNQSYGIYAFDFDDEYAYDGLLDDVADHENDFYKLGLKNGYYSGVQLLIERKTDLDNESLLDTDHDDLWTMPDAYDDEYYTDLLRDKFGTHNIPECKTILEKAKAEMIAACERLTREHGGDILIPRGTFSNGEVAYEYKDQK